MGYIGVDLARHGHDVNFSVSVIYWGLGSERIGGRFCSLGVVLLEGGSSDSYVPVRDVCNAADAARDGVERVQVMIGGGVKANCGRLTTLELRVGGCGSVRSCFAGLQVKLTLTAGTPLGRM